MKLGNVEMTLGVCVSNDDPKKLGRIKVAAAGKFDTATMAIEGLPWVYPLTTNGYQSYSTITEGCKVWLIDNKDNADEFWYIPYHELNADTKAVIGGDVDSDICFSRNVGGKLVQLYQNSSDGIVLRNADTTVNLAGDGACVIESDQGTIRVEGNTVYCGKKGEAQEPMVRGNVLQDILNGLAKNLKTLWQVSAQNPYTAPLAQAFMDASNDITNTISELLSSSCTLSK